ncbi:MAG TPA: ferrous iron transport protein A, partial [Clostridiales bacterium]|nr:ferrous iron transport protein A [Clostridiales bacterium]
MSTLDALPVGSAAVIEALRAGRSLTVRLASLGLVPGERVRVLVNYGTGPVVLAVR